MFKKLTESRYFYSLILLLAALIFGSSFVVVKNSLFTLPPAFIMTVRFFLSFAVLSLIFIKRLKKINLHILYNGIVLGVIMALSNYFQNLGLLLTTPGKNAFLTTSYCIMVPFLYWIIGRSKPDRFNIFAAVICLFGIGMISLNEKFYITEGDFLTLLGGLLIAFQIVFFAVSSFKYDVVLITIVQFATSAIVSLFLHLIFEKIPAVSSFSSSIILQLLYLAVFCTLITMLLQNIGQKHVYPAQASIILSLEAVFAVIFSILFFNEHPSFQIYIGFLAMLMSVIISEGKPRFGKLKKLK